MIFIKAFLTGLAIVSICLGTISGIVTDMSGTLPLSGAAVQLEKGGQTATTGVDGRFTIGFSTGVLHNSYNKVFRPELSVSLDNSLLNVNVAERSAIEVETFDLTGKALSTVHRTLDAGINSFSLPRTGAGVYLYTVKSGRFSFIIKGTSTGMNAKRRTSRIQESVPSIYSAKRKKAAAAIDDVIAIKKAGYLNYREIVTNSDTNGLTIKMLACADTVCDIDGNVYQAVRIGNQVWTAENLRVSKLNDSTAIPLVTYGPFTTPCFCYYNNTNNIDEIKKFGALYNWYAVNTKKLAPAGWHVPSYGEWDTLQNYLIEKGYNWDGTTKSNKIAKSLAAKADWFSDTTIGSIGCDLKRNNTSGFSALPSGFSTFYYESCSEFFISTGCAHLWSATESDSSHAYLFHLDCDYTSLSCGHHHSPMDNLKSSGCSVRLVKD